MFSGASLLTKKIYFNITLPSGWISLLIIILSTKSAILRPYKFAKKCFFFMWIDLKYFYLSAESLVPQPDMQTRGGWRTREVGNKAVVSDGNARAALPTQTHRKCPLIINASSSITAASDIQAIPREYHVIASQTNTKY